MVANPAALSRVPEALLRLQYLASTALSSFGFLILLLYPFKDVTLFSSWLSLMVLPYYMLYGRDLMNSNYRWYDLPRVFALNLLLIPVNLGGVIKSIRQWWTNRTSAFIRTPKVAGRTSAPPLYIVMVLLIALGTCVTGTIAVETGKWTQAAFLFVNALGFGYAFVRFIGPRAAFEDLAIATAPRTGFGLASRVESPSPDLTPASHPGELQKNRSGLPAPL
jgi:hypothetical protein